MRKGRTVTGQDVYSLADGTRVESVSDLVINAENDAIIALLVDEGGLMSSSKIIPVEAISSFGPSAVMVAERDAVIEADADPEVAHILERDGALLDSRVLTVDGDDLGKVNDIYFDEHDGRIVGFEVSGGRLDEVMSGTSFLRLDEIRVVGPDAVITTVETKAHLAEQAGGVQGAMELAGERAGQVREQLEGAAEEAQDRDGTLVGRRSGADVADRTGSIIVARGQRIALEDVREARDAGVIDELYRAAGATRQKTAEDQAKEAADSAAETAGDLWDRFTTKLSQLTDAAGRRVEAEQTKQHLSRINDAIGRPVTKVILDRGDDVILDVGNLVTHEAVQRAYENGMLDSLLDSIYKAEVTFRRDELKARIEGQATIERASGGADLVDELEARKDEEEEGDSDAGVRQTADYSESGTPEPGAAGAGSPPPMDIDRRLDGETVAEPGSASGQRPALLPERPADRPESSLDDPGQHPA